MLALDAHHHPDAAPEVYSVLTTRAVELDMEPFYEGRRQLIKALRRRWPAEYACLLEFTTGYGPRSGGERRPHWNLLYKGIPASAIATVRKLTHRIWCDHVDAEPQGQYVEEVRGVEWVMGYVAQHFQKESQAPPPGFHGQRFNCSRGYFTERTRAEMREWAQLSVADKAQLYEVMSTRGLEAPAAEEWIDERYRIEGLPEWRLYSQRRPELPPPDKSRVAAVPEHIVHAALRWEEREELIAWAYETLGVSA